MSSNKDFLRLENEFRDEIPRLRAKPNIGPVERPFALTKRVSDFLANTSNDSDKKKPISSTSSTASENNNDASSELNGLKNKYTNKEGEQDAHVEMDIFITSE